MIVFRWSAETNLGRLFLLLSASFATALIATPAAQLGNAWASYLAGAAADLAAPVLSVCFCFSRVQRARRDGLSPCCWQCPVAW